jgi:hypothetical protein
MILFVSNTTGGKIQMGDNYIMRFFIVCILRQILFVIKSKTKGWAEHVEFMGKMRNAHKILVGKHEWKKWSLCISDNVVK